ncbi:MAG: DUF481 domain-containing protein [Myxococcota bacterium]
MFAALCVVLAATLTSAEEDKGDDWAGEVSASIAAQSGSVDTFAATIDASGERTWTKDFLSLRFTGVYGISRDRDDTPGKNETDQDSQRLSSRWKHTVRNRFFWGTEAELTRDSTKDLDVRASVATGPGYRVWRGEDADSRHFDVSVALGYRYERYDGNTGPETGTGSLTALNGSDQHLADVIASFEHKNRFLDGRIEWKHSGSVALPANQPDAFLVRTEVIIGIPLIEAWSFRTSVLYEYVNDAPDDVNPSTMRTSVGLGYKF